MGLMSRRFELLGDDGQLYGRLSVEGVLSSLGRVEMEGLSLDLKWSVLIRRGVTILDSGTKEEIGALRLGPFNRGEFTFATGRRFGFKMSTLRARCIVTDDLGDVQFTMIPSTFGSRVRVVLGTGFTSRQELSVMIAATQYALFMSMQEAGYAAASV